MTTRNHPQGSNPEGDNFWESSEIKGQSFDDMDEFIHESDQFGGAKSSSRQSQGISELTDTIFKYIPKRERKVPEMPELLLSSLISPYSLALSKPISVSTIESSYVDLDQKRSNKIE